MVVKVQRPGLRKLFDIDLANMKQLAALLDKGDSARDFTGIYEECRTILYQEIDYINEGRNADRCLLIISSHMSTLILLPSTLQPAPMMSTLLGACSSVAQTWLSICMGENNRL